MKSQTKKKNLAQTSKIKIHYAKLFMTTKTRLGIYKKISAYIEDQVSIDIILKTLYEEYLKVSSIDPRGIMLLDWYNSIVNGKKLFEAMAGWAPPGEQMMIQASEMKGDLSEGFDNAYDSTKSAQDMKKEIMVAVTYPGMLFGMLFTIIYVFSTQAIPKLVAIKPPSEWPDESKSLYELSHFVETKWFLVLIVFVIAAFFCSWSTKNLIGPIRYALDKLPPWSIYKSFQSSVFLISLSAMMKSGSGLVESIEKMKNISPKYINYHLEIMTDNFENGKRTGEALSGSFLDKETRIDIRIFSKTGKIQESMDAIGRNSIKNSIENINKASGLLNLIAMCMVAGFIAWVYYSFFLLTRSVG